jgi:hypothetical protein
MAKSTTCPLCGCPRHSAPQTWETRCAACRELRWPYQVAPPRPGWTCARCRATPAPPQAQRQAGARKRLTTLSTAASQTSQDSHREAAERSAIPLTLSGPPRVG